MHKVYVYMCLEVAEAIDVFLSLNASDLYIINQVSCMAKMSSDSI